MKPVEQPNQLSLAGIRIDAMTRQDLLQVVADARSSSSKRLILNHNLHSLYLYLTDPQFREIYKQATDIYIDGMPVVWLGQLAGLPVHPAQRITFLDCFDSTLLHAQQQGWRVYYLGSSPDAFSKGIGLLQERYPDLHMQGHHGYISLDGLDSESVIDEINTFQPDILFVGMGMPTQESWLARNLSKLRASGILTCGATLDYVSGHAYRPPAWAGPLGLYGVMRMIHDPKRLWRRYLAEPLVLSIKLLFPILRQRMGYEGSTF